MNLNQACTPGRSPILLTERNSQVDEFASRLIGLVKHIVVLKGGMGAKQCRAIAEQLTAMPDGEERVLLATGRYIGEGLDDARLDTLLPSSPFTILPFAIDRARFSPLAIYRSLSFIGVRLIDLERR